jgi:bifunctional DNA-binding transcriptional regulator/antitoxin component of YhaV-PrlF toxin-antitoxin module
MPTALTRSPRSGTLASMPRTKSKPKAPQKEWAKVRMDPGGRIEIPLKFRRKLGLTPGRDVSLAFDADGLHVWSLEARTRRVREIARRHAPKPGEPLVSEELIEERRREAANE